MSRWSRAETDSGPTGGRRDFAIHVSDEVLEDLQERLVRTRWPEGGFASGWQEGANIDYMRELCDYWARAYDWRRHEAELNTNPGFLCKIDGVDLHFWHVRGRGPDPMPLLLLHGWPSSMFEFHHLIGPLTDPAATGGDPRDAFEVVVASLPGFGFGGKPTEAGFGLTRIAGVMDQLMRGELDSASTAYRGVIGVRWSPRRWVRRTRIPLSVFTSTTRSHVRR